MLNSKAWTPHRVILFSYILLIALGTFLLKLPFSTTRGISFIDALFTSTSAVTVTGLVVLDTQRDFTPLGKAVILLLIQVGGVGYLTMTTYTLVLLRRKVGLKERLLLSESLNYPGIYGLIRFAKRVIPIIFLLELVGFLLLLPSMYAHSKDILHALFDALFHSVSAFNNAGFSTFSNNLMDFRSDVMVNLSVALLVVLGGLGFFVLYELLARVRGEIRHLSTHTKLVVLSSSLLILLGFLVILLDAYRWQELSWKEKLLVSFFHSVTSRTAGFNTIDISKLSEATLFFIANLMFVGASPGGTGGGIKTLTAVVIFLAIYSYIRGRGEVVVFERSIPPRVVYKAMVILSLSFAYTTLASLVISEAERKPLLHSLFEVVSAFATVGLSVGNPQGLSLCADFSPLGKLIIILTMLIGRVGVLSFVLAISGREKESRIRHPEARILL